MDLLRSVLEKKAVDLESALTAKAGLTAEEARRFVPEAGTDLIESWRWQANELDTEDVAAASNVRALLRGIGAKRIASRVGLTAEATWNGLRAFVPMVMELARDGLDRSGGGEREPRGEPGPFETLEFGFGLRLVRRSSESSGWPEIRKGIALRWGGEHLGGPRPWSPLEHAIFGYGTRPRQRPPSSEGSVSFG